MYFIIMQYLEGEGKTDGRDLKNTRLQNLTCSIKFHEQLNQVL